LFGIAIHNYESLVKTIFQEMCIWCSIHPVFTICVFRCSVCLCF